MVGGTGPTRGSDQPAKALVGPLNGWETMWGSDREINHAER